MAPGLDPSKFTFSSAEEEACLKELLAGEARFRTIYENAPFMINSFDQDGRVLLWNQACTDLLGYTRKEMESFSDPLKQFYPEEEVRNLVLDRITHPDGQFHEYKVKHRNGQFVHQMWANYSLPDQSLISVGYDITAMRDVQERLRVANQTLEQKVEERTLQLDQQRAKLISSSKFAALGEMAGGIAHEINNPLAVISGYAEQLERMEAEGLATPENRKSTLEGIRNSVIRISKIISGLRAISRDAGRDPRVECSLREVLQDTLGFCNERFRNSGITLEVEGLEADLFVLGRSIELSQILLNLLNNAFDAVQELSQKWVKIKLSANDSSVQVRVTDSGPGVSGVVKEKMFQPFYTTKPIGRGTGIGLSISLGLAEAHSGQLRYELHHGHTSFLLELPRVRAH